MAAALVTSKGLVTVGVVGTRKRGTEIAATLNDQWHLGSDTKAMTATLVAKLVEKGRLKWESTVAEVFPDLAAGFHPEARTITVLQLLSHRSGLKPNPDLIAYGGADGAKERLRVVKDDVEQGADSTSRARITSIPTWDTASWAPSRKGSPANPGNRPCGTRCSARWE